MVHSYYRNLLNLSSNFFIYILGQGKQRLDANDMKKLKGEGKRCRT